MRFPRPAIAVLGICLPLLPLNASLAQNTSAERLLQSASEPQNWLMNLGSYDGSRYSALDQINRENVKNLVTFFSVPLGDLIQGSGNVASAVPMSPLVEDGFIYIVDGWGTVSKLDARNKGAIVWQNKELPKSLDSWLGSGRGLAFYREFVIATASDGNIYWLDKITGEIARMARIDDGKRGSPIIASPLVVDDMLIVGSGAPERGAPGRIDALDARTGNPIWHFDTSASAVGGAIAQTGLYDAASGLTLWGTTHAFPRYEAGERPGDNINANSLLALDAKTGALRWRFQYTPGDRSGFSEAGSYLLVPDMENDAQRSTVAHFANNGFFYALGKEDGAFRTAAPYVEGIEWTRGIDPDTGKPLEYRSGVPLQNYNITSWLSHPDCPNIRGAENFAAAFSSRTGLTYGSGADGCKLADIPAIHTESAPGWLGAYYSGAAGTLGILSAFDPKNGEEKVRRLLDFPAQGGALATAGGLVFATTAEGRLHALNDETLETVWTMKFASLTATPPMTFAVDGKQYIAVVIGGNALVPSLPYQPPEMEMSQPLFVLAVLGLRS